MSKTKEDEIRRLWVEANALHKNLYEVQLPAQLVKGHVKDAEELMAKLRRRSFF